VPGVSAEQVKQAKEVDLLTYLQNNEPFELVKPKHGTDEYRTATHGSLVISKGLWFWNRGQIGGKTAVDYLIKIRGMEFVDAVKTVLGSRGTVDYGAVDSHGGRGSDSSSALPVEDSKPQPKKWDFYPPRPNRYSNKAIAYLQERGISPEVINRAMKEGILFESKYFNPESPYHNAAVCVFAGKDESGKIVFAALRGIDTDFKKDKAGSNKSYNFTLPAKNPNSRHLAVFEAPIDLLSHATLQQRNDWDFDSHRLSLGGTSSVALISFLERNPQITRITLHLDLDAAGISAARTIKAELAKDSRFKHVRVSFSPPRNGAKDYNDALLRTIIAERVLKQIAKQSTRQQVDFSL